MTITEALEQISADIEKFPRDENKKILLRWAASMKAALAGDNGAEGVVVPCRMTLTDARLSNPSDYADAVERAAVDSPLRIAKMMRRCAELVRTSGVVPRSTND